MVRQTLRALVASAALATVETRILISPDGTNVVSVEYNGAPR